MYHHQRCESLLGPGRHSTLCSTENTEIEVDMIMKLKGGSDGWGFRYIFVTHMFAIRSHQISWMDQCFATDFFLYWDYLSCCGLYAVCNYVFFLAFFLNKTYISKYTFCQAAIEMASMLLSWVWLEKKSGKVHELRFKGISAYFWRKDVYSIPHFWKKDIQQLYIYISIHSIPFVSLLLPNRSFVITWCQWCQTTPMGPSWSGLVEIEARLPKLQFVHVFWGFMFSGNPCWKLHHE